MIFSVMYYEIRNIMFYEKNLKLTKKILLIMFFVIEFFFTIVFYQFFNNYWIFINHGLFIGGKYFITLMFPNLKISKKSYNMVIFKINMFFFLMDLLTISVAENFTFKIGNSKVVENIFPEKISHDL